MSNIYDLAIIGGGPGGYVSAIRASQLGIKVVLIEKEHLGGICLNWGCIPTKALLKVSELKSNIENLESFGISFEGNIKFDIEKIVKRSRDISKRLSLGVKHLLKKNNVEVIMGLGKLQSSINNVHKILVSSNDKQKEIVANNVILATGAKPKTIPSIILDDKNIISYKQAMIPKEIPKSIIIVGSGAIGIEFASFYNDMGSEVTIIEAEKSILPVEDSEVSEYLEKLFINRGIEIHKKAMLKNAICNKSGVQANISINNKNLKLVSNKLLMAIGIEGNIKGLGLEELNINIQDGHVITDEFMETNIKSIYAIGDVTGSPWLAHKASHEGILCVEKIAGLKNLSPIIKENIPGCTYSRPQIASVGLTEKKALKKGLPIKVGKFPFSGNGKAITINEEGGFIKTIFNKENGELLGAHLIGPEVTELIHGYTIAKNLETTESELMQTIFPHPTLSEGMHEAVLDAYNKVIHF